MAVSGNKNHLNQLLQRMKQQRDANGGPALRAIAESTGYAVSASTLSRTFNARRPPRWPTIAAVADALNISPAERDVWRTLWSRAIDEHDPAARPCSTCGVAVADKAVHTAWHDRQDRLIEQVEWLHGLVRHRTPGGQPSPRSVNQPSRYTPGPNASGR
jgi:hypothetical protein